MPKNNKNFAKYIFDRYSKNVSVYLPGAKVKGTNYDKFRDVGWTIGQQNPLPVKALINDVSPNELIVRQLGLVLSGAKKLTIKNNDVPLFQYASRIVIKDVDYYVYNDAVGKKFQIQELDDSYSIIILFKKQV